MRDAFFQALFCQPPRVFGRKLRPFSLSHSYLLSALGNAWLTRGAGSRSELFHAVWVCANDHATNARELTRPPLFRMAFFAWRNRGADFEEGRDAFVQYVADYLETPEHWTGAGEGKPFRAPWQYHFVMCATRHCGMTNEQAWNMPVALARCYYDAWAESRGDESLVSAREIELMAAEGMAP